MSNLTIEYIKPGMLVVLRSGGPAMTVDAVYPPNDNCERHTVYCVWFDDTSTMRRAALPVEALEEYEENNDE